MFFTWPMAELLHPTTPSPELPASGPLWLSRLLPVVESATSHELNLLLSRSSSQPHDRIESTGTGTGGSSFMADALATAILATPNDDVDQQLDEAVEPAVLLTEASRICCTCTKRRRPTGSVCSLSNASGRG